MTTIAERFAEPNRRTALLNDAEKLLESEVDSKSGLSGIAIKTAFSLVRGVKPGFTRSVLAALLPDFLVVLEPYVKDQESEILQTFSSKQDEIAEVLLSVTDQKVKSAETPLIKKTYEKLRPAAAKHVASASPGLGKLIFEHLRGD